MTAVAAAEAVWVPRGRPVRNFVLACLAIAVVAAVMGWTGVARARIKGSASWGEINLLTKRFSHTFEVRNEALLSIKIMGFRGDDVVLDHFQSTMIGAGETAQVTVTGRVHCDPVPVEGFDGASVNPAPALRMRVRPFLGAARTVTFGSLEGALTGACEPLSTPVPNSISPPTSHQPNGNPEG